MATWPLCYSRQVSQRTANRMKNILVIGSSNTDMVIRVDGLPLPGQTVLGDQFQIFAGGKGANQAIAAQRAGGNVRILTAVGNDDFGKLAMDALVVEGIDTDAIQVIDDVPSGVALILVDHNGENCIAVASGANAHITPEVLEAHSQLFSDVGFLLIQLETPMDSVEKAIALSRDNNISVILNPAPAAALPDAILQDLFCITPNETELEALTEIEIKNVQDAINAAHVLLQRGVQNVVVTLGESGALICNSEGAHHEPAELVNVVDTTGAGDTFNGVFTAMLADGKHQRDAVRLAVKAASLSVQHAGVRPID